MRGDRRASRRRREAVLAAVALAAASLCACRAAEPPPNLILVTIDNLRADHVGAYGYRRPTPRLDALAREGTLFANASSSSSWTKPAVASLFTSRWPAEHGAVSFERPIDAGLPTLAEALRAAGYATFGFSGNFVHVREDMGFARGFDHWGTLSVEVAAGDPELLWSQPGPTGTTNTRAPRGGELTKWALDQLPADPAKPLFLYVHYMDPHVPWAPDEAHWRAVAGDRPLVPARSQEIVRLAAEHARVPEAERDRLLELYDAEIAVADDAVGALFDGLRERGVCGPCVAVVLADHGEEFEEHGGWFHGSTLYRESVAVPLLLRDFRRAPRGERRTEPVDLLDVAPTLLALAGAPVPAGMRGRDLLADVQPDRVLVRELQEDPSFERAVAPREHRLGLLHWPWDVIVKRDASALAFRLDRDPGEQDPLPAAAAPPELASPEALHAWLERLAKRPDGPGVRLSPEDREALRALGYAH
jgi:arylsulfatase A-like enzyme